MNSTTALPYITMMSTRPVTVVETAEFQRQASTVFSAEEVKDLITHLAYHPTAGSVMRGTGGVRKLRWAASGRGKRGGARVIYFYHNDTLPVFLFSTFAKADRSDLSQAQRNQLKGIVSKIVKVYGGK